MPPSTTPAAGLQDLLDLTRDTSTLLTTFQTALSSTSSSSSSTTTITTTTPSNTADIPPPLPLLRDASTLLKAHTTKLGLLLLNRPFTATAIATVLREARGTCVMGLMSVAAATATATDGRLDNSSNSSSNIPPAVLGDEIRRRVLRLLRAFAEMVAEVGRVCEGEIQAPSPPRQQKTDGKAKDANAHAHAHALTSTATVWEACDALVSLADLGLAGWLARQAEGYREMLVDAVGELREWAAETDGDDDEEDFADGDEDEGKEEEDALFAPPPPPLSDTKLREQLSQSLSKLHSLALLYQALIKRRLKTVPDSSSSSSHNKTIDALMTHLRAIPDEADELAAAFYARDPERASACLERCVAAGAAAAGLVARDWRGQEDGFTVWERRWREAVVVVGGKGGDGS